MLIFKGFVKYGCAKLIKMIDVKVKERICLILLIIAFMFFMLWYLVDYEKGQGSYILIYAIIVTLINAIQSRIICNLKGCESCKMEKEIKEGEKEK